MNENLNKEIEKKIDEYYTYCEEKLKNMADDDTDISFLTLDSFAKYFYNLALSEIESEIQNRMYDANYKSDMSYSVDDTKSGKMYSHEYESLSSVKDYINQLKIKENE